MHPQQVFISLGASITSNQIASPGTLTRVQPDSHRYAHPLTAASNRLDYAQQALQRTAGIELLDCSGYYQTRAWGQQHAGDYLNAAACLATRLPPQRLLQTLLAIEYRLGRRRTRKRWGPRSLDLDILLYARCRVRLQRLQIPHPWLWQRDFVLWPLAELECYLPRPYWQTLRQALAAKPGHKLARPQRRWPV